MEQRQLGRTGLSVGVTGLGTVKLGRLHGLKHVATAPARLPSDDEALALLRTAQELGVNLIDTAPAYGRSEERLGTLLPRVAGRDRWVICTKVGEEFDDDGERASRHDFTAGAIAASLRRSLTRLRMASVDVVLLHFSSAVDDAAVLRGGEALAALRRLKDEGLARAIGASTATVAGGLLAVELGCDVVMLTLNRAQQTELPVLEQARAAGAGVLVKKALAGGREAAEPSLRWTAGLAGVSAVVVGTTDPAHLRANAQALAGQP